MKINNTAMQQHLLLKIVSLSNKASLSKALVYLRNFISYLKVLILLTILWVVLSGNDDPFLIVCGIACILATFVICLAMKVVSPQSYVLRGSFFKYVYVLLRDIIISSIQMLKIIYSEKININPGTTMMNVSNLTDQEKVMFSNMITMTPGTFVIAVDGDNFLIHAINKKDLNFSSNKEMVKLLKKMRNKMDVANNIDNTANVLNNNVDIKVCVDDKMINVDKLVIANKDKKSKKQSQQ